MSIGMCLNMAQIMKKIVPDYPNPIITRDIRAFGPFLELMWAVALGKGDSALQELVGKLLYRWYEHHHRYENARQVLETLREINRNKEDRAGEGVMINNFAFEYLLEEEWDKAIPLFAEAAQILKEHGSPIDHANALANYWTCRFARNDFGLIKDAGRELEFIHRVLAGSEHWHIRKALILKAQLEEHEGNLRKAADLVKKAITVCSRKNSRYPEMDRNYLNFLEGRINH